jgi:hypothetical protein
MANTNADLIMRIEVLEKQVALLLKQDVPNPGVVDDVKDTPGKKSKVPKVPKVPKTPKTPKDPSSDEEVPKKKRTSGYLVFSKAMRDDARAMAIAGLKQQGLIGMDLDDPNVAAKIDAATKQILSREPAFAEAYKGAYGIDFGKMQSSAMPSNVIKYDKKGKEIK